MARADDIHRFTLLEENDSLYADSDRHYTQGMRLSDLSPLIKQDSAWMGPFDLAGTAAPIFSTAQAATQRRVAIFLGQSIFTPQDTKLTQPDPSDRPYGAWLYGGVDLLQETDQHMLEHLELSIGMVGPPAFGRQAQNDYHQLIGVSQAKGWDQGIQAEPGVMLAYDRMWRLPVLGDGAFGVDAVPQLGGAVGNIFTYAGGGALLRMGKNLNGDYGPARIRPGLSGTDYFDGDHLHDKFGFYFYLGVQGRAVARNIFLDGNTFRDSPSVDRNIFIGDAQAGFSAFWSRDLLLNVSVVRRSREFENQASPDFFGTASIGFSW